MGNKIVCQECGTEVGQTALLHHIKKYHCLRMREYKVKHGLYKKSCTQCGCDISTRSVQTKFCSTNCKTRNLVEESHISFPGGSDYVECQICGLRARDLCSHISRTHNLSIKNYKEKYNATVVSETLTENKSQKVTGENNPAYNHGGRLSPWSDKSEFDNQTIEEAKQKAKQTRRQNHSNTTDINYWLSKFDGDEKKAKQALKKRQSNGLTKMKELYGEEDGYKKWIDRNIKWQNSLIKSGLHSGVSQTSKNLFDAIYQYIPDILYGDNETTIRASKVYRVDCYRKKNRKIIEFFGDFWHANPKIFEDSKVIHNRTAKEIRAKDEKKLIDLRNADFDVMVIWEKDYKDNPDIVVKQCVDFLRI